MKTRRFSGKSIVFLFAIAVFFCSVQSPSFAQVELAAESLTRLTEATLHNSTVILVLGGAEFEDDVEYSLRVSGISGVSVDNVKLLDNTEIRVRLKFSGDFDRDATLTFTVWSPGIKNYNGSTLTDEVPVTATVESLTAIPSAPLTEATLDNSMVTLTLRGRTFENNIGGYMPLTDTRSGYQHRVRRGLRVSGISGVTVRDVERLSDTQISVRLEFNSVLNQDDTLTFTVSDSGIKNYDGSDLTDEIRVTATTESLTAIPSVPLTEATLHNSTVMLTLRGRTFENNIRPYVSVSGISGVDIDDVRLLSNTEIRVQLTFSGDFDRDAILTFEVTASGIKNYSGSYLTDEVPVTATVKTQSPVAPEVTTPGRTPPRPTEVASPSRWAFRIRNPTRGTLYYQVQWSNNRSWKNYSVSADDGWRNHWLDVQRVPSGYPRIRFDDIAGDQRVTYRTYTLRTAQLPDNTDIRGNTDIPTYHFEYNQQGDRLDLHRTTQTIPVVSTPQPTVGTTPQPTLVRIPDPNLRAAIQEEIGTQITTNTLLNLTTLEGYDLGISDLTGLEHATNLTELYLWENSISDISPLAGLTQLKTLDLWDNNISDISSLVGLTRLTDLSLEENPLNDAALTTHIPAIQANGTEVEFDDRTPTTSPPPSQNLIDTSTPTGPIDPSQPGIYWGFDDKIQRADLDGSNVQDVITNGLDDLLSGIAVDIVGGKIYWIQAKLWTETGKGQIQSANLDGSNVQTLVTGLAHPRSIALDIVEHKMYWVSDTNLRIDKIQSANLDGSNVRALLTGSGYAGNIALDVGDHKMYWTDSNNRGGTGIYRANLDGSNLTELVSRSSTPGGLALDVIGRKMYWTEADERGESRQGVIYRADFDGSNLTELVRIRDTLPASIALDVAGGKMYWEIWNPSTDRDRTWTSPEILCADLDGSNITNLVSSEAAGAHIENMTLGIPPQTVVSRPTKTTQVHVDAAEQVLVDTTDRPPMYWVDTAAGTVHRLVDAEVENLLPSVRNATSLTVDVANDTLYWAEKTSNTTGKIRRANLDGTNVQLVKNLTSVPLDIALDAANGKLYLTNVWGKVQRMNLDGSGFQPNLITDLDTLTGLAIDVAGGTLYWAEKTSASTGNIQSANLDGTNVQLLRNLTNVPLDIALDTVDDKLYLTNSQGNVQRMNLDGSGFQPNLITGLDTRVHIAVDTVSQKLYLTSADGKISRRNFSGGGSEEVVTGLGTPGGLVLGDAIFDDMADDQMDDTTPQTTADDTMANVFDVNNDGTVDDKDANLVSNAIKNGSTDAKYDVNGDGVVNHLDYVLVLGNRDRNPYDVNGDGTVNDQDASLLTDAISNGSTDAKYDVNDDGKVNFDDLQLVLDNRERNPYDINNDGTVDDKDASLLTNAISNGSTDAKYDVNDDGKVNFDDLQLVLDNRDSGAAGAPFIGGNLKLTAAQMARIQEQIALLIATGDRSPAAMRTLIYLQQFLAMARPEKTQLLANYPNPFNPETWIPYQLSTGSDVRITLYDVKGKVVRRLVLGYQSAGYYTARSRAAYWDGRNAVGEPVASGLYFYTFTAGDFTATRRMLIMK